MVLARTRINDPNNDTFYPFSILKNKKKENQYVAVNVNVVVGHYNKSVFVKLSTRLPYEYPLSSGGGGDVWCIAASSEAT